MTDLLNGWDKNRYISLCYERKQMVFPYIWLRLCCVQNKMWDVLIYNNNLVNTFIKQWWVTFACAGRIS